MIEFNMQPKNSLNFTDNLLVKRFYTNLIKKIGLSLQSY
jgi:hypothetical protein